MAGLVLPFKGKHPRIATDAFVAPTVTIIGDVEIGPGASIWFGCVLRGDVNFIRVGRDTNIQDGTVIHVNSDRDGEGGMPTVIGDGVVIGHCCLIHACTLEDSCFIGMRASVMDRVVVEKNAMVAGGAVVTPGKRVKSGQLWGGYPARYLRDLSDDDRAETRYIAAHYRELAAQYRNTIG
ncbi:MAG TPA: gamma carbonic anhydrase family protein [Alphaproteobacteria bacterium]|nr:gamma carbonic anhydrase family protein [Alphaproteobacteria bacterium]